MPILDAVSRALRMTGVVVGRSLERAGTMYGEELRRIYNAWQADYAMFRGIEEPEPSTQVVEDSRGMTSEDVSGSNRVKSPPLNLGRIAMHFTGPFSPSIWGTVLAVLMHNVRAGIEWFKFPVNGAYQTDSHPFQPHPEHKSSAWRTVVGILGFPGAVAGAILGAVTTTLWVNLAAIPYMVVGMGRLASKGEFAGVYDDDLQPRVRHTVGFVGTLIGFALGLVPFVIIAGARIVKHSVHSFFEAIEVPGRIMRDAWSVKKSTPQDSKIRFSWKRVDEKMRGSKQPPRSSIEAYFLGFPGLVAGAALGSVFAVAMFVVGTFRFFRQNFMLSFLNVVNAVAAEPLYEDTDRSLDQDYTTIMNDGPLPAEDFTPLQRYGYGWLGTLVGAGFGLVSATFIVLLRISVNSARLFDSVAQGLIALTVGVKPTNNPALWGFNRENSFPKRWIYGVPGILLAAACVGIPCLIYKALQAILYLGVIVASLVVLTPVRAGRSLYRRYKDDMTFSQKNQIGNSDAEIIMHSILANGIGADGELVVGSVIRTLSDEQHQQPNFVFGFWANVVYFFRRVALFDQRTEVEEAAHGILRRFREECSKTEITIDHLKAVTEEISAAVAKLGFNSEATESDDDKRLEQADPSKRQTKTELKALGRLICHRLLDAAPDAEGMYNWYQNQRGCLLPRSSGSRSFVHNKDSKQLYAPLQAGKSALGDDELLDDSAVGIRLNSVRRARIDDRFFATEGAYGPFSSSREPFHPNTHVAAHSSPSYPTRYRNG